MDRYLLLALLPFAATSAAAEPVTGIGRPIDGDLLMVGQQEVRLFGIDAPEFTQTSHEPASLGLAAQPRRISFRSSWLATCELRIHGHGSVWTHIGAVHCRGDRREPVMVATGYALAFRRYSMDYIGAEESARLESVVGQRTFQQPSDVRHGDDGHQIATRKVKRPPQSERPVVSSVRSRPQPSGCRIKGNRSRKGDWIYHLPGMPYYAQTKAEEVFCTEAEARDAGYRRSRADKHH